MFGGQNTFGGGFGQQSQPQSVFGTPFGGFGAGASTSAGGVGGAGGFGGFGQPPPTGSSSFAFGPTSSTPSGGMFAQSGNPFGNAGITSSSVTPTLIPNGTLSPPYSTTNDKDPSGTTNTFHSITAMPQYRNFSFEELRMADYQLNRKPSTGASYGGINTPAYMGATSTGSGFGGFGSQTLGFGAKSTPSFAFSNNPTPTPAVGFGATPAGPSNQSLFGTQKPAFGAPTGGFGSTSQPTGNFGTGFGGGSSLFGSTSSGTQPSMFGLKSQPASTSGFGPAMGGFNTPSFGFANKSTAITGGFGAPATNSSFSGFGATTNPPSLNMGGFGSTSKPSFGFNQTSIGTGTNFLAPTTSSSMFNINPAASTSTPSLGFTAFNKPAVPTLGGPSLTTLQTQPSGYLGGGSLSFGNTSIATAFGNTGQNQGLQATVNSTPYGEISVFQATTPAVTPNKPSVAATPLASSPLKKKPVGTPNYKLTPRPSSKLKLAGFNSPAYAYPGFGTPDPKPLHIFESLDKKEILSPEAFIKRNPRKLVLDRSVEAEELLSGTDSQIGSPQNDHTPVRQRVSFDAKLESGADNVYHSFSPNSIKPSSSRQIEFSDNITSTPSKTPLKTPSKTHIETDNSPKIEEISTSPPPDNNGYYSVPSVKDLLEMKPDELKAVVGFMVGRTNFGKIEFQDPVDFSDVTSLDDVLGKIIRFEDQNCTVYGPDYIKPSPGHGLNKRAVITLDRCWALDKSDRRPIKDPEDLRYRQRIERLKNVSDTKYITFLPETGSWVFQVEHFTTYGLIFDDPEDQFEEKQYQPFEVPIIHMTEAKPFPQSRKGKEKEYDDDKLKPITNFPESLGQDPDDIDEMQNVLFNDSNEEDYMQMDIAGDSVIEEFDESHKRGLEGDEHDEYIKAESHSSVVEVS